MLGKSLARLLVLVTPALLAGPANAQTPPLTISPVSVKISLTGSGSPPATVLPTSLSFSSQTITTTSAPKTVTLTNNQGVALSLLASAITANFALAGGTCGSSLSAFGKCTYLVTFTPPAVGSFTGSVTINLGSPNSTLTVGITGTGVTTGIQSVSVAPAKVSILSRTSQQFTATANLSNGVRSRSQL